MDMRQRVIDYFSSYIFFINVHANIITSIAIEIFPNKMLVQRIWRHHIEPQFLKHTEQHIIYASLCIIKSNYSSTIHAHTYTY